MPKYDFHCNTCNAEFSESLPMGTLTLPSCPTCRNAKAVRKLIRAPMVHFKGSGFYKTEGRKDPVASEPVKPVTEKKPDAPSAAAKPVTDTQKP